MNALLVLPYEAWPSDDQAMWQALVREGGLLDDRGSLAHLRKTSQQTLLVRYGRWLGWLSQAEPQALTNPPVDRATPERLWRLINEGLAHTAPMTRLLLLDGLLRVLMAAVPEADWSAQKRLATILRGKANQCHGARKAGRILSTVALLEAGLNLAGPQANEAITPREAARRRRDGAMLALLALMPMRRRALAALELRKSVQVGRAGIAILLSPDMTKNGLPWEARVPELLVPVLRRYIEDARPWFLSKTGSAHDWLWVTDRGTPYDGNRLGMRIGKVTQRLTGVRVPPHFFRDAAATSLSRLSPENARLIRPLLGHSSYGTAERHYIQALNIEAGRDYAAVLAALL